MQLIKTSCLVLDLCALFFRYGVYLKHTKFDIPNSKLPLLIVYAWPPFFSIEHSTDPRAQLILQQQRYVYYLHIVHERAQNEHGSTFQAS